MIYAIYNQNKYNYFVFDDVRNTCIACSVVEYTANYKDKVSVIKSYYDVKPNLKLYLLLKDRQVIVKDKIWLGYVATYSIYTEVIYKSQLNILSRLRIFFNYCEQDFYDSIDVRVDLKILNWSYENYIERGSNYFTATFICPMEYMVCLLNSDELVQDLLSKSYFKFDGKSYNLLN